LIVNGVVDRNLLARVDHRRGVERRNHQVRRVGQVHGEARVAHVVVFSIVFVHLAECGHVAVVVKGVSIAKAEATIANTTLYPIRIKILV
jgi:hypothetical protein